MANGSDGRDPWGRRGQDGPPDLLQLFNKLFKKRPARGGGSTPSGDNPPILRYIGIGAGVIFALWILLGIFLVSPAEEAVVLRFGHYVETVGPGPHWIPPLIDSEQVINVQQISTFSYEAEMLTKDENIVSVSLAVQYRIGNPEAYLFNVVDPIKALHQATSSALRQVVGEMTLDSVLTTGRQQLRDAVAKQLDKTLALYNTGLSVTDVTLQPVKPPEAVTAAFDDAIKAREDQQRYVNRAQAYARKVILTAKGQIARIKQSADAYEQSTVLQAKGETARFKALLRAYKDAPNVTEERLYLQSLSDVLSKTTNIVVSNSKGQNVLYLPLQQLLQDASKQNSRKAAANGSTHSNNATQTHHSGTSSTTAARPATRPTHAPRHTSTQRAPWQGENA